MTSGKQSRHSKRSRSNSSIHDEDINEVISISSTEADESTLLDKNSNLNLKIKIKKEPGLYHSAEIEELGKPSILSSLIPTMAPYAKFMYRVSAIYVFWILLHYTTAHMYVRFCAAPGLYGLIVSPFLISAPHCIAMRWVFAKGGTIIEGMWILAGTWLCSKIITR